MFTLLDEQKARKFWEEEIRQESEVKGVNRYNALLVKLIAMNRFDDIKRCSEDSEFRDKLFKEFKLA